jgi:hypothetical protein
VYPEAMSANHLAIFSVSRPRGRVSVMLGYLSRVGSCQMKALLPPSSRDSITTSQPSPSHVLNVPRSALSRATV